MGERAEELRKASKLPRITGSSENQTETGHRTWCLLSAWTERRHMCWSTQTWILRELPRDDFLQKGNPGLS